MFQVVVAVVLFLAVWKLGSFVIRTVSTPPPPPPPSGELRRVNLRYRCSVCGAEVKMTSAPDELPEPPRHCMDEMDLVAPVFE